MSGFADDIRDGVCSIWQNSPGRFYGSSPLGGRLPVVGAFYRLMNGYCDGVDGFIPPEPETPFTGGQCPVQYDVGTTWTVTRNLTGQTFTASGTTRVLGPVGNAGTQVNAGFIGGYLTTGNGIVLATDSFDTSEWSDFSWGIQSVSRVDGLPDNCGDPDIVFPDTPPPGGDGPIDINISVDIGGGNIVDIPVSIDVRLDDLKLDVNFNGELIGEVNIGGGNYDIDIGGGGGGDVDLGPVLDAIGETRGDIEIFKDETLQSLDEQTLKLDNVLSELNELSDFVQEILSILGRLGEAEEIPIAGDDDVCTNDEQLPTSIFNALSIVGNELKRILQSNCESNIRPETFRGTYVSTIEQSSFYIPVRSDCKSVTITIIGDLPPKLTYTQSNEASGYFGAIAATLNNSAGSYEIIYTREHFYTLPNSAFPLGIRVFMKPGITFQVNETGEFYR